MLMCYVRRFVCAIYVTFLVAPLLAGPACDQNPSANVTEGNIGESAHFPWLGVLRVHLHHGETMKIALTGLIFVKPKYAIANSDDVSRIPKMVFREDSRAMFIPKMGEPWYSKVRDYLMHPEYEFSTYNTIALVQLALEDGERVPFQPICWPRYFYNTSNELYALGFTDDNKLLEKMVYKLQYVKLSLCNEFYKKSKLTIYKTTPTHLQCGFAKNNKKDCTWENGMALASNSSGKWTLIGISLRGPGCAAPARFIDMFPYLPWIESATDLEEISDVDFGMSIRRDFPAAPPAQRRPPGKVAGGNREDDLLPAHGPTGKATGGKASGGSRENYWRRTKQDRRRRISNATKGSSKEEIPLQDATYSYPYGVDIEAQRPYVIERVDRDAIAIHTFGEMYEKPEGSCSSYKNLVYRDKLRLLEATMKTGRASYRISIYDMVMAGYTCVKIKIKSRRRGQAQLWYRFDIDQPDWFSDQGGPETPPELLKYYRLPSNQPKAVPGEDETWEPASHLEAQYLTHKGDYKNIRNVNILVWFYFKIEATMELEVYGLQIPMWFPPLNATVTPQHSKTPKPVERSSNVVDKSVNTIDNKTNLRRLHHTYKNASRIKNDKIKVKVIRRKYSPNDPNSSRAYIHNRHNSRRKNNSYRRPSVKLRNSSSSHSKKQLRRLHQSHRKGFIKPKNPYRLQKAMLRQADRLAMGPAS